eukprot:CAMPEP_0195153132 /NCGR_PEP_ID=MMETSP0448-20130528/182992_1 /TAXON_ID=66468 /ORGANISM="Heterocapsa triquestra, Strain CCMP 448" /LENGTH=625 /DNA_ID=CAMNT_0040191899 /DNA_START=84 /DNA_END=1962 /DNA_ORIENTATION=-
MPVTELKKSPILEEYIKNGDVVGICVSGGLDSKTVALRLRLAGVKVKCFTADIGQPDEENINDVVTKMAPCGVDTVVVDLKDEIAEGALEAVACQGSYDGGYWQSTGIGRYVTARGLLLAMKKAGCTVLSHGATGRGNDQVRFERYVNVMDPNFKVYAPWRDPVLLEEFPGRTQMLEFLQSHGIGHTIVSQAKKRYSTDANICGLSNEAEDLESIETPMTIVNPIMGVWPKDAPAKEEEVTLRFEAGRCVAINGKTMKPLEVLQMANTIGGVPGPQQMLEFLQGHGIGHTIVSQAKKRYSTDANICGLSNEAEDLESIETPMTIVNPIMGVWPKDAPEKQEEITLRFEAGRCVAINGKTMKPLEVLQMANAIGGRNGLGISHALENRILDANICGLSNEAEDLESIETPMTIVNPIMGVWPKGAPEKEEEVTLRFEAGRCVAINGKTMKPLEVLQTANTIGGRNGVGISHALENRILGTKSRGVYEAPGMCLLGQGLQFVYQAVLDRRSTNLFQMMSKHISDQIYDGRYFDPSTRTAINACWDLAAPASGTVSMGLYKGHMHFLSLKECPHSIYFEADSSMEASEGLNPCSSQGYLEVSSVEAKSMAKAGLIDVTSVWTKRRKLA